MLISITVTGIDEALRRLSKLQSTQFRSDLMVLVGAVAQRQTVRRFDTKTDPSGKPWAPRKGKPEGKRIRGRGKARWHGLLTKTGRLKGSITASNPNPLQALVSTNVMYAGFHQFGTRKMVARSFMGVGGNDESEIERAAAAFIRQELSI